jgi:recombination associated protein RdgC
MWFKNVHFYRFLKPLALSESILQDALQTALFHPCGKLEMERVGWVSPFGRESDVLTLHYQGCFLVTAKRQERLLPASVVQEALAERIENIEIREQRRVRGKEKKALQEEIIRELIPQAFTRSQKSQAYIDTKNGWLVLNTSNRKKAQEIIHLLRQTLGSLPVVIPQFKQAPATVLTEWLATQDYPPDFALADACQLVDAGAEGATVSCRHQDLAAEEVHGHLKAGKAVNRLALVWNDHLSFVLDEECVIKRLQIENINTDTPETTDNDAPHHPNNDAQQLEADFILLTAELTALIQRLIEVFGGENETAYQQMQSD